MWLLEKQANHRCSWGSISSHPFWQPNPPAAPGTLPAQPLFDSIIATLERTISKQLEDQAIHDAERIFEQKSDFKDDSGYINPNLTAFAARNLATTEENAHVHMLESKYHSNSAPNLIASQLPPTSSSYATPAGHGQPNPTPMKVLPRSESTPIRPVAKPPPSIPVPLYSQNHPNTDNKAQEKGSTLPSTTPSKYAKDTQQLANATSDETTTIARTVLSKQQQQQQQQQQDSQLKDRMNLHHHPSPAAMNVTTNSNITTPLRSRANHMTGFDD